MARRMADGAARMPPASGRSQTPGFKPRARPPARALQAGRSQQAGSALSSRAAEQARAARRALLRALLLLRHLALDSQASQVMTASVCTSG